ncbi:UDP-N-acetylmuramyl pentapeptide phosphotransferase [Brevibacillus fluminis]|uniref:UDP-N-acetylmuramyl pentapeptide phosphotransferase n=1 Tax=Brevibacillus fluminis TaxID=511487 RepID=UPI003F8B6BBA
MAEIEALLFLMLAFALPLFFHLVFYRYTLAWLCKTDMVCRNYRGERLPTGGGVLLAMSVTISMLILYLLTSPWGIDREFSLFLCGSVAMTFWGWQDDRSQETTVKGMRGHFMTLWREQRMTSGFLKAWGVLGTSLLLSIALSPQGWDVLVNTLVLALFANLINLFDLRPGRAIKVFWLFMIVLFVASGEVIAGMIWPWLIPIVTATLLFYIADARGKVLLGDTGANYLGFILGFYTVTLVDSVVKTALLVLLIGLHLLAERVSFSHIIASIGWLQKLDRLGTVAGRSDKQT